MGGKGQKRREKNFEAAHGGNARLPPPPNPRDLDALPSKLRKIMGFINPSSIKTGPKGIAASEKKSNPKDLHSSTGINLKVEDRTMRKDTDAHSNSNDGRKKKQKRKEVNDLRFQELDDAAAHMRKKARKKEYFKAKKNKQKKTKKDDVLEFPGHEVIKFGEVVEAPPKLSFSKALKTPLNASRERARLQAIESYRNHKGWVSRPGNLLPTLPETTSS